MAQSRLAKLVSNIGGIMARNGLPWQTGVGRHAGRRLHRRGHSPALPERRTDIADGRHRPRPPRPRPGQGNAGAAVHISYGPSGQAGNRGSSLPESGRDLWRGSAQVLRNPRRGQSVEAGGASAVPVAERSASVAGDVMILLVESTAIGYRLIQSTATVVIRRPSGEYR